MPSTTPNQSVPVTVENFIRAESDRYFGAVVRDAAGIGKMLHNREVTPIDKQTVVRQNRDTLYSAAVFDLDAGPVTISLPDAGTRFMSLQIFDEDEYVVEVVYGGSHGYSREKVGTRYMMAAVRTLIDPDDPADAKKVHALQDAIRIEQRGPGRFEVPHWDDVSQKKVRDALTVLGAGLPDSHHTFGGKGEAGIDPVRRLIGAAIAWGGNPERDATYINVTPVQNDGKAMYRLTVKDVPVDGFWSVIVYDASGYIPKNTLNKYSFNNLTAKKDADGSVTIQFGGCDEKTLNCLPIVPGWNYLVRLYRPRAEILSGTWKFPEVQPVN
jgi:hypothetical protein